MIPETTELLSEVLQHLKLVLVASTLSSMIGISLGIMLTRGRLRVASGLLMNAANIAQAVPSLAVVALAMPIVAMVGLPRYSVGQAPAIIALVLYGLLPILRNTFAGISSVDASMIEAARGMGMSGTQILAKVELPIAIPVIMAGIRTSVVISIGTACLAFLIGGEGLGVFIFTGIAMHQPSYMLAGAIPAAALAVCADWSLQKLEQRLTPEGIRL